jgi:hypothetical protein
MNVSVSGNFDDLQRELQELQAAMASLNGDVAKLHFTSDPESINAAIQEMERVVNNKLSGYMHNPMVATIAEHAKEQYRNKIHEVASGKR